MLLLCAGLRGYVYAAYATFPALLLCLLLSSVEGGEWILCTRCAANFDGIG
jgi:hypothetical protein